ncbi:MAG TPA: ATP-binding cassette domain-containing protein [Polyangia bacterium]|jgi:osmoprotectant transport system ATP-binding protein|nr:ATP-binding cassette domain-containing protein [Polyangia bacterium]
MLELVGVSKRYGATEALDAIDLAIPAGQTTVLIGPSGCGKSTLLRLAVGLVAADRGQIRFDGEVVGADNLSSVRRRTGYVIQDGGLFPHLTAEENVLLMARYLGWDRGRINARRDELVALTRFPTGGLARYPVELSGGQRQRVSLMRALMLDPAVLFLDEPLGALDPMIRADLQDDLRRIFRELGKTVVLVTHDIGEAAFFGDVIVLLRAGGIVQRGSLQDMVAHPADAFVTRFINAQRSALELSSA